MEEMRNAIKVAVIAALPVLAAALAAPAAAQGVGVRADVGGVQIGIAAGDARLGPVVVGPHHRPGKHPRPPHRPRPPHLRPRQNKPEPQLFGSGPVNDFARDQKRAAQDQAKRPRRPYRPYRKPSVYVPYGYYTYYDPDDYVSEGEAYVRGEEPYSYHDISPGEAYVRGLTDGNVLEVAPEAAEPEAADVSEAPPERVYPDASGPRFERARGTTARRPALAAGQRLPADLPYVLLDWEAYGLPRPPEGEVYVRLRGQVLRIDATTLVVREIVSPSQG